MITREQLDAMPPAERVALFEDLVRRHGATWSDLADQLGVTRKTLVNWRNNEIVPDTAIFTLSAWVDGPGGASAQLADIAEIGQQLEQAAASLQRVAQLAERIARRIG